LREGRHHLGIAWARRVGRGEVHGFQFGRHHRWRPHLGQAGL